jgi:hypothetical protein
VPAAQLGQKGSQSHGGAIISIAQPRPFAWNTLRSDRG